MADDWSARAHTRPGYATYADTPAGDPTSPHRPPARRQTEAPKAEQVPPAVQAPATWWVSAEQVAEFVERAGVRLDPWQRQLLDQVYAAPSPLTREIDAPRLGGTWTRPPWWRRTLRRITRRS